jgi:hypothetical protein
MRHRCPKEGQHRIPGVRLDGPAVTFNLLAHPPEALGLDVSELFWIELLRQRGEADEVAKEGSDQTALLLRW